MPGLVHTSCRSESSNIDLVGLDNIIEQSTMPGLVHTSCRSESSNINLVVLDNIIEQSTMTGLVHTSCRSESSNFSLVVLDNITLCPRLKSEVHFLREPSKLIKLLYLSPRFTLSGWRPTWLSPWSWEEKVSRNTKTSARSVPSTTGHLSGEI